METFSWDKYSKNLKEAGKLNIAARWALQNDDLELATQKLKEEIAILGCMLNRGYDAKFNQEVEKEVIGLYATAWHLEGGIRTLKRLKSKIKSN